jgi:hypothetical protein
MAKAITTEGLTMGQSAILERQPAKTPGEMSLYVLNGSEVGIPSISQLISHLGYAAEPFANWQLDFIRSSIARVNETFNLKLSLVSDPNLADMPVVGTSQMGKSALSGISDRPFYGSNWLIMTLGVGLPINTAGTGFVGSHNDGPNTGWKKIWLHELGHLLGLEHPWDVTSEATPWIADTDFDITSVNDTPYAETMMGYTNPDLTWDEWYEPIDLYALANIWGLKGSSSTILNFGAREKINATETVLRPAANTFNEVTRLVEQTTAKLSLQVQGTASNDHFLNTDASETIDGSFGVDTFLVGKNYAANEILKSSNIIQFEYADSSEASDTLTNVERLQFNDLSIAYDVSGSAGTTAKLLGATFGKASIANKYLVGIGLHMLDGGISYSDLMGTVINAILGSSASNAAAVDLLYTNVVGAAPSVNDLAFFTDWLDKGIYTKASFGVLAADTELNIVNVGLVGLASTGLEYTPYVA